MTFAHIFLRLSKKEFFRLTPRTFANLCEQWRRERHELRTLFSLVRVDLINHSFNRPEKRVQLGDLLPPLGKPEIEPRKRMTVRRRQQVADKIRALFAANLQES